MIKFKTPVTRCAAILILSAMMVLTGCKSEATMKYSDKYEHKDIEVLVDKYPYEVVKFGNECFFVYQRGGVAKVSCPDWRE